MKMKMKLLKIIAFAFFSVIIGTSAAVAQIATKVTFYDSPVSLPDVTTPEFGTARDNLLTRVKMGGPLATGSRVNDPTGLEIRTSSEAGDISVSVSSNLWRSVFNPGGAYATQHGQRKYDPVLIVGVDGKVSLSRVSYHVFCGVGLLSNQSSLAGLDYSISRIGIQAGPDGQLFTADDVFVQSGSGTNLVDAVLFIGARVGADVENSADLVSLDAAIGPSGTYIWYQYQFQSTSSVITHDYVVSLFQRGGIPSLKNTVEYFHGPKGMTFSLVGPAGSAPITMHSSRSVIGPWSLVTATATEGTSGFWYFTGNPTNDQGYFKLGNTQAVVSVLFKPAKSVIGSLNGAKLIIVSSEGTESDQDR